MSREAVEFSDYIVINLADNNPLYYSILQDPKEFTDLLTNIKRKKTLEMGYIAALEYEYYDLYKDKKFPNLDEIEKRTAFAIYNNYQYSSYVPLHKNPMIFLKLDTSLPRKTLDQVIEIATKTQIDGLILGSLEPLTTKTDPG